MTLNQRVPGSSPGAPTTLLARYVMTNFVKFVAELIGESDGYTVFRAFEEKPDAIAWLQNAGLAEFADQQATGQVRDADGRIVWLKAHLQSAESADRERSREWGRVYAGRDMIVQPMRGGGGYRAVPLKGKKGG